MAFTTELLVSSCWHQSTLCSRCMPTSVSDANSIPDFQGLRTYTTLSQNRLRHSTSLSSTNERIFSNPRVRCSSCTPSPCTRFGICSNHISRAFPSLARESLSFNKFAAFSASPSSSDFSSANESFPFSKEDSLAPDRNDFFNYALPSSQNSLSVLRQALSTAEAPVLTPKTENDHLVQPPFNGDSNKIVTDNSSSSLLSSEFFLKLPPEALQYESGYLGGISDKTRSNDGPIIGSDFCHTDGAVGYLRSILTSRVYDVAIESPLEIAHKLTQQFETPIYLKREDMQRVFSFKLRGAYNMMAQLSVEQRARGVICSSAGNHAQGVALSASQLNCKAIIAMPVTTPEIKWRSVEKLGAEVVLVGESYDDTQAYAKKRALEEGMMFIPPFDDHEVIAGQGTVGMEILRQHPEALHAIFVPVGGGGLIAGIAAYVKALRPEIRVIGVEPADANAMALSLYHGRRVQLERVGGFADGVAVKVVGEETFKLCRDLVDGIVLVDRDSICAAIKSMFEETRSILEPAGALALAGAKAYCRYYGLKDRAVVAVTSGANMNFDRLRMVAELAGVGARREFVLVTTLPEIPGSFKTFCHMVGKSVNITEFKYRYRDENVAQVLYSLNSRDTDEVLDVIKRLNDYGFATVDLSKNNLAKDHLRHLVGGRAEIQNEILYRFVFPERPGALMKFLDMLSPRWNITLFHYRTNGEERANVLVGLQILEEEEQEFNSCLSILGYAYEDERNNPAFSMFLK